MRLFEWKLDREATALHFVMDRYVPVVGFDNSFGDGEAKPPSFVVRSSRCLATKGDLEDSPDVGFGYTPASINHRQECVIARSTGLYVDRSVAGRVMNGILEQIAHDTSHLGQ